MSGEYVERLDVWVTQTKLPLCVKGFCKRKGGYDCVVINDALNDEKKQEVFEHEMRHIKNNDLKSEKSIEEIEK